uniref:EGF like domain multiple 6 n=1 Tax=Anolis carolinensis TaxID=28377 RepID=G1KRA9_ANOCA
GWMVICWACFGCVFLHGRGLNWMGFEPNVCPEQELAMVGHRQPCVQAFIRTTKIWKQDCAVERWCLRYERRTSYYTIYKQTHSIKHHTVFKCCPGWSRKNDDEAGCLHSVCSVCFNGGKCSEGISPVCQCSLGFQGPRCQYDVNECSTENGGCQGQCCNTIGSFYCKCPVGQKLGEDRRSCEDIDECAVKNGGCQHTCMNILDSYHCECDAAHRLHADGHTCIEIDPCENGNGGCLHICQNENGFAKCQCYSGYSLSADGKSCTDVDECAEGTSRCTHLCMNTLGSFACICNPGFELGRDGRQCYRIEMEIVNSCEDNNGGCSHHCEHSTKGPLCSCNQGYLLDFDEKTCIDLDECETGDACCSQFCINYVRGYECSCKAGFRLSLDGCGCDDEDELEEEDEEELEIVGSPDLRFRRPPQLLHFSTSLSSFYDDDDDNEDIRGELALVHRVVCLSDMFGSDCSLSCSDCMNRGNCNSNNTGCDCPPGWTGIICNESEYCTSDNHPEDFQLTLHIFSFNINIT